MKPYRPLKLALSAVAAFAAGSWAYWYFLDWGEPAENESPIGEISRWCERVADGFLREPVNTLGNLGFVVAGLLMFLILARDHVTTKHVENHFIGNQSIALLYASAALFLGPGSMLMHGTHTFFGAWIDNVSMVAYILVPVLYNLKTLGRWTNRTMFGTYAVLLIGYGLGYWFLDPGLGIHLELFEVAIPIWIITEALIRFDVGWFRWLSGLLGFVVAAVFGILPQEMLEAPEEYWWVILFWLPAVVMRGRVPVLRWYFPWFVLGVAAFFGAYAIWLTGTDTSTQCDPDSLIQPQAIWHLITAFATFAFFMYFRTEEDRDSYIPSESWSNLEGTG